MIKLLHKPFWKTWYKVRQTHFQIPNPTVTDDTNLHIAPLKLLSLCTLLYWEWRSTRCIWMTKLRPCVGPSGRDPQPHSTMIWLIAWIAFEMIGLIWQGKTCTIYNRGRCKQGSHSITPPHPEPLCFLSLSLFLISVSVFIAVWVTVMAEPGSLHFHF